jgi:putative transposase
VARRTRLQDETNRRLSGDSPRAVAIWEAGVEGACAVVACPADVRLRLRTTNARERLNRAMRRRERVIRIVPNRASAERI